MQQAADRTVTETIVMDAVCDAAWADGQHAPMASPCGFTPEELQGKAADDYTLSQRMMSEASPGSVDRATRSPRA